MKLLLRCMSLEVAPNGPRQPGRRCPFPGVEQTCRAAGQTSQFDPERNLRGRPRCSFDGTISEWLSWVFDISPWVAKPLHGRTVL